MSVCVYTGERWDVKNYIGGKKRSTSIGQLKYPPDDRQKMRIDCSSYLNSRRELPMQTEAERFEKLQTKRVGEDSILSHSALCVCSVWCLLLYFCPLTHTLAFAVHLV
jgi:hypothetical protein